MTSFETGTLNSWCVIHYGAEPVENLVCDVIDEGVFEASWTNTDTYDSLLIRSGTEIIAVLAAGPYGAGTETVFDNGADPLPTPQLARIEIIGIVDGPVGEIASAPHSCDVALLADPLVEIAEEPDAPLSPSSPPYLGVLTFDPDTEDFEISDVQVDVDITHPFIGELAVSIASSSGTAVTLHDAEGESAVDLDLTYWDLGVELRPERSVCECLVRPTGPGRLADFAGEETVNDINGVAVGAWVVDASTSGEEDGTVNAVAIRVFDAAPTFPAEHVSCGDGDELGTVTGSWVNGSEYSEILVFVNGALAETLTDGPYPAGEEMAFTTEIQPVPSVVRIGVRGVNETGAPGPIVTCRHVVAVPALSDLACSSALGSSTVDLSWRNNFAYDEIRIYVDGAVFPTETIVGAEETFTLDGPFSLPSVVTAEVEGYVESVAAASERVVCSVFLMEGAELQICEERPVAPESEIDVLEAFTVDELEVVTDITSDFVSGDDYDIVSPIGTTVRLHGIGGPAMPGRVLVVWDDDGIPFDPDELACGCAMMPSGPGDMADFDGELSSGTWTLAVMGFGGVRVNEWCLRINNCGFLLPSDISCESTGPDAITLAWTNADDYDEITVLENGIEIETLAGDEESYEITGLETGRYRYELAFNREDPDCTIRSETCRGVVGINEFCGDPDQSIGLLFEDSVTITDAEQVGEIQVVYEMSGVFSPSSLDIESPVGTRVVLHDRGLGLARVGEPDEPRLR